MARQRDPGHPAIALGTLEEAPGIRPGSHSFVASKAPWFEISDGLPRFAADAARHSE